MLTIILTLALAFIALLSISLLKIYTHVPKIELKRRARNGDDFADLLYKAAAYGPSAQLLLWIFIGLSAAGFFVLLSYSAARWLALLLSVGLVWFGFAWLPNTKTGTVGKIAARNLTPSFTWLLEHLYPVLEKLSRWLMKYARISIHTGLYEKEDIVNLINRQKNQHDNRISEPELHTMQGALTYGDKLVRDVMTPQRVTKSIAVTESVGPHLLDELHKSGHSRFPVYQDKPDNVIGMLYVRDLLNAKEGGQVKDYMKKDVFYIHEDQTLNQALQAFLKTKHHLFIVVNSFEEKVGIVTLEDIVEQILGKPVIDEFDKYDDLRAVAALHARTEHDKHPEPAPDLPKEETKPKTD